MSSNECNGERPPSQAHGKILNPCPRRKIFRLPGKIISDLMQGVFADRTGDNRIPFTGQQLGCGYIESMESGSCGGFGGMTRNVTRRFTDDLKVTALGQDEIPQGGLDDFGSNSGGVSPRNADANDIHAPRRIDVFTPPSDWPSRLRVREGGEGWAGQGTPICHECGRRGS